jgi:hypothetical protein
MTNGFKNDLMLGSVKPKFSSIELFTRAGAKTDLAVTHIDSNHQC